MLLTQDMLLGRLAELVRDATAIDIATAWASPGQAMDAVLERAGSIPLRAIVGIAGWATHPSALRAFAEGGHLRIPTKAPLFHPKVILFHHGERTTAWIGSANLTRSGYQQNREVMFEVAEGHGIRQWFDEIWASLPHDPSDVVDDYEANWRPDRAFHEPIADLEETGPVPSVLDPLPDGADWAAYVEAIGRASRFWKSQNVHWTVDGEGPSWLTTINLGNAIVKRADFARLTYLEYRVLLGIELRGEHSAYGLLGSMKGAGLAKEAFNPSNGRPPAVRLHVRKLLQPVMDSSFEDFPEVASRFIARISEIEGFAGSVATRLIVLARPDLAVSVNNGSKAMLELYSGIRGSALSKPRRPKASGSYPELLEYLGTQPWYRSPKPRNPYERMLSSSRGALLDAIAYGHGWR
ncbi:phospholipase D family protein [Devosia sp.]|uniref:phospholipase D family protein n=1 Tax=Devosia sp. TaxID=1871048 RepID=UPI001A0CB541|nr:phospholipase D family protein [Devosia sp.]MBE0581266.1 phospholipase D family protein [Devosia sp.]